MSPRLFDRDPLGAVGAVAFSIDVERPLGIYAVTYRSC